MIFNSCPCKIKLLQVNGDTLFMTSNFKEFKLESSSNGTWDQQNAVASTAVCASIYAFPSLSVCS